MRWVHDACAPTSGPPPGPGNVMVINDGPRFSLCGVCSEPLDREGYARAVRRAEVGWLVVVAALAFGLTVFVVLLTSAMVPA